jgi:hypothetical protein
MLLPLPPLASHSYLALQVHVQFMPAVPLLSWAESTSAAAVAVAAAAGTLLPYRPCYMNPAR